MAWSGFTLVTDPDLHQYEPQTGSGALKQITWPNQRANAKLELESWLVTDFQAKVGPDIVDKIRDTYAADKVWAYTDGDYTDVLVEASSATEDDVDLSAAFVTVNTDRIYIGSPGSFDGLHVRMLANLNAETAALTVKYSGAAGWTTLTHTNGTDVGGKTFAQSGRIAWTQPGDWQRRTLNNSAESFYWVELSVSAALTAGTSLGQLLIVRPPTGLKRVALLLALGYIMQNMATQAPSTDYWMYKARNQWKTGYLDLAEKKYAEMRDKGGIPIDLNDDGVVDASETSITIDPHRLERA